MIDKLKTPSLMKVVKHYSDLSLDEFHDILQLRINVFVVEQNCPYAELDGKDKLSYHIYLKDNTTDKICACARILPQGISYPEVSIGRVASDTNRRGRGIGQELMKQTLNFITEKFGEVSVRISAQKYLVEFYESFDFVSTGKEYLEDDIPHVEMILVSN
jgi:ElaA protein